MHNLMLVVIKLCVEIVKLNIDEVTSHTSHDIVDMQYSVNIKRKKAGAITAKTYSFHHTFWLSPLD